MKMWMSDGFKIEISADDMVVVQESRNVCPQGSMSKLRLNEQKGIEGDSSGECSTI